MILRITFMFSGLQEQEPLAAEQSPRPYNINIGNLHATVMKFQCGPLKVRFPGFQFVAFFFFFLSESCLFAQAALMLPNLLPVF